MRACVPPESRWALCQGRERALWSLAHLPVATKRECACEMDPNLKGWFAEFGSMWPGEVKALEVEEVLFQGKSDFQDVLVFKSKSYGNVLVLDGVIQVTERDEFAYQEMIAHLPIGSHPNPKKVLVIGGGDGGVLREIAKHPGVESIELCEIDKMVPEVSKKYLPALAAGFDDPRVTVHIADGFKFLAERKNMYDVIITDSSDPVGPAASLFQQPFYELLRDALRDGGVVCSQGESMWLHLDLIKDMCGKCRSIYGRNNVSYAFTTIPTYPSGQIGFFLCHKRPGLDAPYFGGAPKTTLPESVLADLKYYSNEVHEAAFVLPAFAKRAIFEA